jgi:hypothetical protein
MTTATVIEMLDLSASVKKVSLLVHDPPKLSFKVRHVKKKMSDKDGWNN